MFDFNYQRYKTVLRGGFLFIAAGSFADNFPTFKDTVVLERMLKLFSRYKLVILYGLSLALLTFLLKWLEFRFLVVSHAFDIYIGFIAIIFTALGIWLAQKLLKPKVETVVQEKTIYVQRADSFIRNDAAVQIAGLSKRELEVLQLMAAGMSNQEIASQLFVSLNTIKTHAANLFLKLEVKRRTQAIEKAKKLQLIP